MKNLFDLIDLKNGDIVSVVGSGGKTTFMYKLSKELSNKKVIITTSTKMFIPKEDEKFNIIFLNESKNINLEKGINFLIGEIVSENKFHTNVELIDENVYGFDYLLIESDGSKRKPLKGWNETEPVISKRTNKTVGIIPIDIIGKVAKEDIIHRIEKFSKISLISEGEEITPEAIANVISSKNGLFKNSVGEKILFLNKIENKKQYEMACKLLKILERKNININKIIGGSLLNESYFLF
ncbi:selenium cofactor biosynthesis protein YqeC [Clostridium sp.]|uniref:selenium cofactor biosynthesis protein YqeC n=1 Tax=Clostridium sp. TaxID=1506 RepID=UPI0026DD4868|nr:selenium cofactor biosynthesis protein YqeC [Clostridium sp.]MDO5038558.1 selenium cofactor biosynthesis protein YqeC [Clostridium sp.]